jgi:diaminopimelate epimerase
MLSFAKVHGLGNDFLVVDLRAGDTTPSVQTPEAARALCDRRFGVGGDGVLAILPSSVADARMRVLNSDGSEAEMCGNGIRCVAKQLHDRDPALRREVIQIETLAGVLACRITTGADGLASTVSVAMGHPRLARGEVPMTGPQAERCLEQAVPGLDLAVTCVSMGNPHAVAFVDETGDALRARAERQGPVLETHAWFPRRTNVELTHVTGPDSLELVVWERGCGITLACGTGACATAVAACLTGRATAGQPIRVRLLGGELEITVAPDYSGVTMTGPATLVYDAQVHLAALLAR